MTATTYGEFCYRHGAEMQDHDDCDQTRTEFGVRYPDGHTEALYSSPVYVAMLPAHAADHGGALVQRDVRDGVPGPWTAVQR